MDEVTPAGRKRGFPPVADARTQILILGSLPGEISLANAQYYGNPRNAFWRLVSAVTGADLVPLAYPERLDVLLAHHIGLWDVIAEARRDGSLDTRIRERCDNDLLALAATLPRLHTVAFNGGTAGRIGRKLLAGASVPYRVVELPSSSPAHTLAFDAKRAIWLERLKR